MVILLQNLDLELVIQTIISLIDKPFEAMINEDEFFGNWSHQAVGWV